MARTLVYSMGAAYEVTGLGAPEYTPFLLEAEVDFRVIVEEPFGNLLDVECLVVEVLDLRRGHPGGADEQQSGKEAIQLAQTLSPDVVLMDVEMPSMDGIAATAALRVAAPHVAVVILSLYDDARTRARAREAGATAFVAKHQAKTALLATIRRVVSGIEKGDTP
jgi:CheY-like chemotaxis protein